MIALPVLLVALVAFLAGYVGGHESGYHKGVADQRARSERWQRSRERT